MSKICNRNYQDNAMYSMKVINGISCCPSCEQPASCHNQTTEFCALFWALACETGTSSMAIARHMCGIKREHGFAFMPPSDADDRRRCIKLLELIPEWIAHLPEMVKYDAPDVKPQGITIGGSGISAYDNSWQKQIPLIIKEGNL